MKKTHSSLTRQGSSLNKYQDVIVGSRSIGGLMYYEWCMFLGPVPGALGIALRKLFWPRMFGSCGNGCMFGANITVRHPRRIRLGNSVIISEGCILDGRHSNSDTSLILGDNIMLSNNVMISCKDGTVAIGNNVGVNAFTVIQSTNDCPVRIAEDCIIGQGCFIIGGGNYNMDRLDVPIRLQGIKNDGGVDIENDVWLGGKVTVLGGVTVGQSSVVAAGALMTRSVPERSICMGVPARVVRTRTSS